MTDNEIIKALECCTNNISSCKDCLYEFSHTENKWCDEVLIEDAFALITRQKAEIERLTTLAKLGNMRANDYRAMRDKLKNANADIDFLKNELSNCEFLKKELEIDMRTAKAEAIKEFADLSIKRICEQVSAPTPSESYVVERCNQVIDNTKKEMVGMCDERTRQKVD